MPKVLHRTLLGIGVAALVVAVVGAVVGARPARADFFIHHWELFHAPTQELDMDLEALIYSTSSNYDATGNSQPIPLLNSYSRFEGDLTGVYGLFKDFSVFARLTYAAVDVNLTTGPGSAYGLGDQSVGGSWRVYEIKPKLPTDYGIAVDLQAQVDLPAYSTATFTTSNEPVLGDGSVDITAGGFITLPISQNKDNAFLAVGGAGYTYRTASFSSAVPWSAEIKFAPKNKGFSAAVAGLGIISMHTDPNGDNTINGNPSRGVSGTGNSFISGAINPSILDVRAEIAYDFTEQFSGSFAYDRAVWGQAAPAGSAFIFGVQASFGGGKGGGTVSHSVHKPVELSRSNEGFVKYSLDAKILKSNDRLNLVKIDKGSQDGVEVGQIFDIFEVKQDGSPGEAIARGQVTAVNMTESAVSIRDYFKEMLIDEGFVARRLIH